MRISQLIFWALGLLVCLSGQAQVDSIPTEEENLAVTIDSIEKKRPKERRPGQALKWAIIPGGGQIYNRSWWKVPIVYGALITSIGVADFNSSNYQRVVRALEAKCFGDNIPEDCEEREHEFTGTVLDDVDALVRSRDAFDRNQQTAYIFVFFTYLLQGIEAFTDAHLKTFDIDDDISFRLRPVLQPGQQVGLGLSIPLGAGLKEKKQKAILLGR
ncbi:MAG: DUF5683 domain-containing protein [Bacteroidota bacterium]